MDTLPSINVTSAWSSLNDASGIDVGDRMTVSNLGPTTVLVSVSELEPTALNYGIPLEPYHTISVRGGQNTVWARATPLGTTCVVSCQDGVTASPVSATSSAIAKFDGLSVDYLRSLSVDTSEAYAGAGLRYRFFDDDTLADSASKLILIVIPAGAMAKIGFNLRELKGLDGACSLEIFTDPTINQADIGAQLPTFNEFKRAGVTNGSPSTNALFYDLSAFTGGVLADTDFTPSYGSGGGASGASSLSNAFRIYESDPLTDQQIVVRVNNLHNQNNRILLRYEFVEFSLAIFE